MGINPGIGGSYLLDPASQVAGGSSLIAKFRTRFLDNVLAGELVDCVAELFPHGGAPVPAAQRLGE
ncbi:hypothetical protein NP544_25815 [Pseudomonas monteilii]|uniref:hypothetical protein n=1 Tax=Pseudomonas TaxID=286 RepID=UPI0023641177|nr:hypothetical protein [Pseudomonas monteilii]MDD2126964.1 hypothetical protein [Pseudomonas monteilii]